MRSTKGLAAFVLVVGGVTSCFLTFGVAVSYLFYIFTRPPLVSQILGYASLAGPLPLLIGSVLLFFHRTQRLGARLTLAGSFILSVYVIICYMRLEVYSVPILERLLWFVLAPVAVLAVDAASYRIYKLTQPMAGKSAIVS